MRLQRWWWVLGAVAVPLSACASGGAQLPAVGSDAPSGASPSAVAGLSDYYGQSVSWRECGPRLTCTTVRVPRDYAAPDAGDLGIAVARYSSAGGDRPALVINPGGPGASGVEYARAANQIVAPDVLAAYDVVGFDPRGVGDSDPVDCLSNAETDRIIAADPDPDTAAEVAEFEQNARMVAAGCQRRSPDIVGHLASESVVRDMDIVRAALGEERLNYLGKSYGTKLGALYAEDFPERTGRMVLDGVLPPELSAAEVSQGQARGFEDALRRYVAWCQESAPGCPLSGDGVDAGVIEIQRLLQQLESQPLPTDERELTEGMALQSILFHLYYPYAGDWRLLNDGLRDAFAGDGDTLRRMLDTRMRRDDAGRYDSRGNSYDAFIAITCLDGQADTDAEQLAQRAEDWRRDAPTFGAALSWSERVCTDWPVPAPGRPRPVDAAGAGPILVVAASHDPATPLAWAQSLVADLADAHLIVLDADGHTAYYNGSGCIDRAVADYLLSARVPAADATCDDGRAP
jgi:pimeloyl-ACP methyl ester carboxylesterase